MRCLIITETPDTGGLKSHLFNLLSIHKEQKIETFLIIPKSTSTAFISEIEDLGNSYLLVRNFPINANVYYRLYLEWIYLNPLIVSFKPDFVIVNTGNPAHYFSPFLLNFPLIYILHSLSYPLSWKSILISLIPQIFSNKRKRFYTVSNKAADEMVKNWMLSSKYISVIYNSFNQKNIVDKDLARGSTILTLGHVIDYKNPKLWIEVAEEITEKYPYLNFIWLGDGPLLQECRNLTKSNDKIQFLGHCSNPQLFYKATYIYFQPSLLESQGIAVVDAQVNGIPCIVSDIGGLPEVVVNNQTGYVIPNVKEKYVYSFISLLNNDTLHKQFSNAARERALRIFDPIVMKENILSLYKLLLNK